MSRWITNLESKDHTAKLVAAAKAALVDAPDGAAKREAEAQLARARYVAADVERTLRQIELENGGRISIGDPQPTEWRTAEQIKADGIIGVYLQGAGN